MTIRPLALLLSTLCFVASAVTQTPAPPPAPSPAATPAQKMLLQLAADAFANMPLEPHRKNRARGQMSVVEAALELGDLPFAERLADAIPDWRRGLAHAECALHLARRGAKSEALQHAAIAEAVARSVASDPDEQGWRPARVLATLARAHLALGDDAEFARLSTSLEAADAAAIQRDAAMTMPEDAFAKWIARADEEFAGTQFDSILATLDTCCALFGRFFDDVEKRDGLQRRVLEAYPKLPRDARLKLMLQLASTAAERGDGVRALGLCTEADRIVAGVRFHPEDEVYLKARIGGVVWRAGDTADGRKRIAAAQQVYDEQEKAIADIYRAAALRSIAEAVADAGDREHALRIYARAVEAGVANPNSRPRADDVAATCVSLARRGIEPPEALAGRLREVVGALRAPW